jgi:hypothetical protein
VADEDELLTLGPRHSMRRFWIGAVLVAVLVLAAFVVIRLWPRSASGPAAAVSTPAPQTTGAPTSPVVQRPWPTARGACGGRTDLPIVSSTPAAERPHVALHLLVGGSGLHAVDFASGRAGVVPGLRLQPGEFVADIVGARPYYAVIARCGMAGPSRLVSLRPGHTENIPLDSTVDGVFDDPPWVWAVTYPTDERPHGFVVRLVPAFAGGYRMRLPAGFVPEGITNGLILGSTASDGLVSIQLVDAATGRTLAGLGPGRVLGAAHGMLAWTDCDPSRPEACTVYWQYASPDQFPESLVIPRPAGFGAGVISADHRRLAFTMSRGEPDPRYADDHPFPPSTVAVLHLDTGVIDVALGIEIPAKTMPGLAFGPDGWLAIALDAGPRIRLLAWHRGLLQPYETRSVGGPALNPPALALDSG